MNEQEQISQLSALFDGELPRQQADMVIRRAVKDAELRASWERYALIGACLRGEPVSARNSLADRVQASLANERELNITVLPSRHALGGGEAGSRSAWLQRGALGGAIAAGVAVMSIFVVRAMAPAGESLGVAVAEVVQPRSELIIGAAPERLPAGYTTPGTNAPVTRGIVDASLGYYLVAHSEGAASALRSSYDLGQGGMELTDDQISALR